MIKPQTLKGFRDFLPNYVKKKEYVLNALKEVFESYGFEPIETPALEYEEILTGKYGEEGEKLMYKFTDNGGRKVALRYDQTVPLARFVAQNQNEIVFPFKRYQIQPVWRAENTQKGRYREFLQVDCDIAGSSSPLSDNEVLLLLCDSLRKLGFKNFKILVNYRTSFNSIGLTDKKLADVLRAIDKIKKIGRENVIKELEEKGFSKNEAEKILKQIDEMKPPKELEEVTKKEKNVEFFPALARGLDYYTGIVFEAEVEGYEVGSIAGGGRYDNLIGIFSGKEIPAVGFAFGFDRLLEAMETLNLFPKNLTVTKVLVTSGTKASEIAQKLRENNINTELYIDEKDLEKQLKYAVKKQIPYVVLINENGLVLKNMEKRTQEESTLEEIINKLKKC
jgi:histidyl-tRNA synthetase